MATLSDDHFAGLNNIVNGGADSLPSLYNAHEASIVAIQASVTTTSPLTAVGLNAAGKVTSAVSTVAIGTAAARDLTTGSFNTVVGNAALLVATDASSSVFMGDGAGGLADSGASNNCVGRNSGQNVTGDFNCMFGEGTGKNTTTGSANVFIGHTAGFANISGATNVFIGLSAGAANTTQANNVMVGNGAGSAATAAGCVMLGKEAGKNETADNKLHIANNSASSLIGGDFSAATISLNGNVFITAIKSGADLGASGAAANELWKTDTHATLPDNVVLIGV